MYDFVLRVAASFAPPLYDVVWSAVPFVLLAVTIAGLVSFARRSPEMPGFESLVWLLIVIVAPLIGTVLWFAIGRRQYPSPPRARRSQPQAVE